MRAFVFMTVLSLVSGCYGALSGSECFVEGTMINTPSGMQPIESIKPGDTVSSFLAQEGAIGDAVVVETEVHEGRTDVYELTLADYTQLKVTADHKFPTGAKLNRLRVVELVVGDQIHLLDSEGELQPIAIISKEKIPNSSRVYNLVVRNAEGDNYYFAENVLTVDY